MADNNKSMTAGNSAETENNTSMADGKPAVADGKPAAADGKPAAADEKPAKVYEEMSMENDNKPDEIGRYVIEEELGRGGMATVYKACDPNFEREVAVKVLPQSLLHDPKFRKRFDREGKMIAHLEHHAIVPVYDFGEHERQPYIVMRLMTGGDLAKRIRHTSLSQDEASRILSRIAGALDVAHANGVIHRDLKPGNVLFDSYGDAYLSDFGIARLMEGDATLTGSSLIGTPAYMSPEQIQGEKNIDGRSDIYSLGVILYRMLSGNMPFEADTPGKVMIQHILEPVPDISLDHPDISPAVSAVITKAMAKDPDQRYQTADEMAQAYKAARLAKAPDPSSIASPENVSPDDTIPHEPAATIPQDASDGVPANWLAAVASKLSDPSELGEPSVTVPESSTPTSVVSADGTISSGDAIIGAVSTEIVNEQESSGPQLSLETRQISDPDLSPEATHGVEPSAAAQTTSASLNQEPQNKSSGQNKTSVWKWALPVVALVIVAGLVAFFVINRSGGNAASPIAVVSTPTESATQPAVIANEPTPTVEEALPTATVPPATPTTIIEPSDELSEAEFSAFLESANIVVFEDMVSRGEVPYVKDTLDDMVLPHKWDGNARGRILADLASGPETGDAWDLAIIALENRDISSGEVLGPLVEALNAGSSVILEIWHLDHTTQDAVDELLEICGLEVKEYFPKTDSTQDFIVYPISGISHPILSEPNAGLQFNNPRTKWLASEDLGDLMSVTGSGDAQLLIGIDSTQKTSGGVLTTCLDGRLTLLTFSSHTFPYATMAPLWENMIINALKARALSLQAE